MKNLRDRWITAMTKITMTLVDGEKLTGEMGIRLARCFMETAPQHPRLQVVEGLEREAEMLEKGEMPAPEPKQKMERIKRVKTPGATPNDYPTPWCTVKNANHEIIGYTDAGGKAIPNELWPRK